MHAYFNAGAKRICEDNTTKMWVEVGLSKSFLCIPDFPYFGAKLTYDTNGEPILVTPKQVKEILLASKWKDTIYLYQGAISQGQKLPQVRHLHGVLQHLQFPRWTTHPQPQGLQLYAQPHHPYYPSHQKVGWCPHLPSVLEVWPLY
jgi:hypothetical protein